MKETAEASADLSAPGAPEEETNGKAAVAPTLPLAPHLALVDKILANPELAIDLDTMEELTRLLPAEDGIPVETQWHRCAINFLCEILSFLWRDRDNFFVGGDMFIYYSLRQVRYEDFKGPDFFYVAGVDRHRLRRFWATWEESGKYPNTIVELLSPSTARTDRTTKKDVYERIFRTPEYFCYDPDTRHLEGWRLHGHAYAAIEPDERGWMWSEELGLWLGTWDGIYQGRQATWLRFYQRDGQLVLIEAEAAKLQIAAAEAELTLLKARLEQLEKGLPASGQP